MAPEHPMMFRPLRGRPYKCEAANQPVIRVSQKPENISLLSTTYFD